MEERFNKLQRCIQNIAVKLSNDLQNTKHADDDSLVDLNEIQSLNSQQQLEQIGTIAQDLLRKVRDFRMMDEFEGFQTQEQYQKALQKLEQEVRNHIKIEQQLKLYIESTQGKLDESEKARLGLAKSTKSDKGDQEIQNLKKQLSQDASRVQELEKQIKRQEQQYSQEKQVLEDHNKKCSFLQKKIEQLNNQKQKENNPDLANSISEFYKRKYQEKCEEVIQLELRLKMGQRQAIQPKKASKSPNTCKKSPTIRRNESNLLATTRSSKKLLCRNTSQDKMRRHRHGSSTNSNTGSYLVNSSRR